MQDFHAFFEEAGDNTGPKTVEDKFFEAEVLFFVNYFSISVTYTVPKK